MRVRVVGEPPVTGCAMCRCVAAVPPRSVEASADMVRAVEPAFVIPKPRTAVFTRPFGAGANQLGKQIVGWAAFHYASQKGGGAGRERTSAAYAALNAGDSGARSFLFLECVRIRPPETSVKRVLAHPIGPQSTVVHRAIRDGRQIPCAAIDTLPPDGIQRGMALREAGCVVCGPCEI